MPSTAGRWARKGILATSDGGAHWRLQCAVSYPYRLHGGDLQRRPSRLGRGRHGQRRDRARVHHGDQRRRGALGDAALRRQRPPQRRLFRRLTAWLGRGQRRRALPHDRRRPDLGAQPDEHLMGARRGRVQRRRARLGHRASALGLSDGLRRRRQERLGCCCSSSRCSGRSTAARHGRWSSRPTGSPHRSSSPTWPAGTSPPRLERSAASAAAARLRIVPEKITLWIG